MATAASHLAIKKVASSFGLEIMTLALEVLSDRLSPGGYITVDDYGFFSKGAQTAVDNYLSEHPGRFDLEIPSYCRDRFAILKHRA